MHSEHGLLIFYRLEPYSEGLRQRYAAYKKTLDFINEHEGGLAQFSEGHKKMGLQVDANGGVTYREWAPGAAEARLIGEFSECCLSDRTKRSALTDTP